MNEVPIKSGPKPWDEMTEEDKAAAIRKAKKNATKK